MTPRKTLQLGLALLAASTGTAFAMPNNFVNSAMIGGADETLLVQQAGNTFKETDIQTYVGVMVKDHTIINEQLAEIAKKHDIDLPVPPTQIAPPPKIPGKSAQASFAANQVDVTQVLFDLYTQEANSSDEPDLKAFAQLQLKDVRRHARMASRLSKTYKK